MAHPYDEFADLGFSQWAGLGVKLGGRETVEWLLREEVKVARSSDTLAVVEEKMPLLFDSNSRRIPPRGLQSAQRDANPQFHLLQPTIKHDDRLKRLQDAAGRDVEFPSTTEVADRCGAIRETIAANPQIANLVKGKGVSLDLAFPKLDFNDLGDVIERAVAIAGRSYKVEFRGRQFVNHRQGNLRGKVSIIPGVRHEIFIARLLGFSAGSHVAVWFPNSLQGYSVLAQREQMASLPEYFILSALDTPFAMAMYPDVLARDQYTPGPDLSAVQWQGPSHSLCFRAYDAVLAFGSWGILGFTYEDFSGGLLVLG